MMYTAPPAEDESAEEDPLAAESGVDADADSGEPTPADD